MNRYIAILRGINVSGKHLIKMADLRSTFEKMGFQQVTTYIQSGNIIFSGKKINENKLEDAISRQLKKDFGFDTPVIVLTGKDLEKVIVENPFVKHPGKKPEFMHVTFLASAPKSFNMEEIEAKKMEKEEIVYRDKVIYLYCPNGYGNTKLNNTFLEKKLQVTATTRNWKTTNELLKIAENTI